MNERGHSTGRRTFLHAAGAALGAVVAAPRGASETPPAHEPLAQDRSATAHRLRTEVAGTRHSRGLARQTSNDDEQRLGPGVAFSKGLPHDRWGAVKPAAFQQLLAALASGRSEDFERIRLGKVTKLTNPQAGLAFVLDGPDAQELAIPPAPGFSSAEAAGEAAELYWMALLRDVPFSQYDRDPLVRAAAADLSRRSDFRGPKRGSQVTDAMLFRDRAPRSASGPFVSQFLFKDVRQGAFPLVQRLRTVVPGIDYLFTYARWLGIQDGDVAGRNQYDPIPRHIRTGRDLAEYVHQDFTYQAFLNAALILLHEEREYGRRPNLLDRGNAYYYSENQSGFCTFGEAHVLDMVARVVNCALAAAWYQKWWVHRRLRPEEYAGRVHLVRTGQADYPVHADLLESEALERTREKHGTYLLPQAYPEGCPTHPAYPAGHAVIAGACTTVLKAFFNDALLVPEPVLPNEDGTALVSYDGPELTIGGELDKLAYNVAVARNFAGIHWRTDAWAGLRLGETVALAVLNDMAGCYNEAGWDLTLTSFDGELMTIRPPSRGGARRS